MLRLVLVLILIVVVARAFWRVVDGIVEGLGGQPRRPPKGQRGVHMERDPVCGTFVIPERAVSLSNGASRLYFCSTDCCDKYRGGISSPSAPPARSAGSRSA
ncbi:MAG: hypothetical protein ACM3SQ_10740 [Betaproteobacteria bacterium]